MSADWTTWAETPPPGAVRDLVAGAPPYGAAAVWLRHRVLEAIITIAPFMTRAVNESTSPSPPPDKAVEMMLAPIISAVFGEWIEAQHPSPDVGPTVQRFAQYVADVVMLQATGGKPPPTPETPPDPTGSTRKQSMN